MTVQQFTDRRGEGRVRRVVSDDVQEKCLAIKANAIFKLLREELTGPSGAYFSLHSRYQKCKQNTQKAACQRPDQCPVEPSDFPFELHQQQVCL